MTPYVKDALERVAATIVVAALGSLTVWMAAGAPMGKPAMLAAATPVVVALFDVVKVVLARFVGNKDSASFVN